MKTSCWIICSECEGNGKKRINIFRRKTCVSCGGTGFVKTVPLSVSSISSSPSQEDNGITLTEVAVTTMLLDNLSPSPISQEETSVGDGGMSGGAGASGSYNDSGIDSSSSNDSSSSFSSDNSNSSFSSDSGGSSGD